MRIGFTTHAVERYVERYAPTLTFEEARRQLEAAAASAVRLRRKTFDGHTQWRIEQLDCELVTKPDPANKEHVCVTILPKFEENDQRQAQQVEEYLAQQDLLEASLRADRQAAQAKVADRQQEHTQLRAERRQHHNAPLASNPPSERITQQQLLKDQRDLLKEQRDQHAALTRLALHEIQTLDRKLALVLAEERIIRGLRKAQRQRATDRINHRQIVESLKVAVAAIVADPTSPTAIATIAAISQINPAFVSPHFYLQQKTELPLDDDVEILEAQFEPETIEAEA